MIYVHMHVWYVRNYIAPKGVDPLLLKIFCHYQMQYHTNVSVCPSFSANIYVYMCYLQIFVVLESELY